MEIWGGKEICKDHLFWPVFGSFEDWICQALNLYVNSKEPFSQEESDYARLWIGSETRINLYPLKEKGDEKHDKRRNKRHEEEIPVTPPPYVPPPLPPVPAPSPNAPPLVPNLEEADPSQPIGPVTRSKTRQQQYQVTGHLYPLREIAMGYVAVPLNSGDVRDFKKRKRGVF